RQLYWGWSNFAPPPTAGSWRDRLSRHCSRDLEGRGAVSGSLAGMFPARRLPPRLQIVGKSWQFSKLPADPGMESMGGREAREGAYLLRTNLKAETAEELWSQYMQLTEAEASFRALKSELSIRPLFHQLEPRVKAHVMVAF